MDYWNGFHWVTVEDYTDMSLLDDAIILSDPPEYQYPGWHTELEPEDYASSHDWTMDYDYPDDYNYDYEDDNA